MLQIKIYVHFPIIMQRKWTQCISKQISSNIEKMELNRTGSAAYFWLIGFLVHFLCIVAPPVGTRSFRVRLAFFYRTRYVVRRSPSLRLVIPGIAVSPGVTHSDSRIVFVTGTVVKP